jgi:hypothetical protein
MLEVMNRLARAYAGRLLIRQIGHTKACSTFPAATANRRSARTISRAPVQTAPRIS